MLIPIMLPKFESTDKINGIDDVIIVKTIKT